MRELDLQKKLKEVLEIEYAMLGLKPKILQGNEFKNTAKGKHALKPDLVILDHSEFKVPYQTKKYMAGPIGIEFKDSERCGHDALVSGIVKQLKESYVGQEYITNDGIIFKLNSTAFATTTSIKNGWIGYQPTDSKEPNYMGHWWCNFYIQRFCWKMGIAVLKRHTQNMKLGYSIGNHFFYLNGESVMHDG